MEARRVRLLAAATLVLSLLGTGAVAWLRFFSVLPLIAAAAAGCILYLAFERRGPAGDAGAPPSDGDPASRRRVRYLAATAFFVLSAVSLLLVASSAYAKPVSYYVVMAVAGGAVAAFLGASETRREYLAGMVLVWLLAMNLFGSNQLAFPLGIGGADSSTHIYFLAAPIAETGHVPPVSGCGLIYGDFPVHHILVASSAIVADADPVRMYYDLGFVVMTIPVLATFLVVRRLFPERTAAFAALFLAGASYYISWASHAAPLTYAIPLISVLLLLLIRMVNDRGRRDIFLAAVVGLALILTHPYSSVIFGVALFGLLATQLVSAERPRVIGRGTTTVGVLFAYTLIFDWSNFSCLMTKSLQLAGGWAQAFQDEAVIAPQGVYDALPLGSIFVNTLGDSVLLALAVVGFFVTLGTVRSVHRVVILGPTLALLTLSVVGIVTDLVYILPNRIYVYLQLVGLAPLAAVAIWRVAAGASGPARAPGRRVGSRLIAPFVVLLAAAFVFASTTSTIAGFETSPFAGTRPYVKLYDTNVEARSVEWLCAHATRALGIDTSLSFSSLLRHELRECLILPNATVLRMDAVNGTIDPLQFAPGTTILFSRYDSFPGYQSGITGVGKAGLGVYDRLEPGAERVLKDFNRIYSNGGIEIYAVPR
jgi:hypothetical protein